MARQLVGVGDRSGDEGPDILSDLGVVKGATTVELVVTPLLPGNSEMPAELAPDIGGPVEQALELPVEPEELATEEFAGAGEAFVERAQEAAALSPPANMPEEFPPDGPSRRVH
ncbi:hypothetical protein Nepgr_002784 [Nepenthes gracilis]|uniref:Uncharacterized protein n=1 Tax=Nepenthes gracilis TaxID=150966 RepID=A0AAD3P4A5_NEPGR|nr:hypothetical protein Nepgr_002784 [Nepenthes gracilis]